MKFVLISVVIQYNIFRTLNISFLYLITIVFESCNYNKEELKNEVRGKQQKTGLVTGVIYNSEGGRHTLVNSRFHYH